jgi:hypothetical protein
MSKSKSNSRKSFEKGQGKNTTFGSQEKIIFYFLQKQTATATMVSCATGIAQKNICRLKRNLERDGKLQEVSRGICKATGFMAYYLTTNTALFKQHYLKK